MRSQSGGPDGLDRYGSLNVDFIGAGIVNLCSMSADERGVTKEGCAAWYSALLSFKLARTRVVFYFNAADPGNAGLTTCAGLGDWTARTPYFLQTI